MSTTDTNTSSSAASRVSRRFGPLPIVAIIAAVLVAGLLIVDRALSPAGDTVAVLGDSITFVTTGKIFQEFDNEYKVIGDAKLGARVEDMQPTADSLAPQKPQQLIVDLGTNDVLLDTPIDQAGASLREMIGKFKDAKCIHVVNINTHMTSDGAPVPDAARAMNEQIDKIAADDHRIDVIDWDGMVGGSVDDQHPAGTFTADTVHPSEEGQRALADAMADSLARCGRPWHFW